MFKTFNEAQAFHKTLAIQAADPLTSDIEAARAQQNLYFDSLKGTLPAVEKVLNQTIKTAAGDMNIRLIYPTGPGPFGYVVFVRGAGWWAGGLDSHMQTLTTLANLSSMVVCAVDYYKTPEHHYPTQVHQVIDTLEYLQAHRVALDLKGRGFLFGESAGATIALSVSQHLRDRKNHMLAGLILFYCNADGYKPKAREYSRWVWMQYMGVDQAVIEHEAVPLQQSLENLPQMWIGVGGDDPLIADSEKLRDQLAAVGETPDYKVFAGLPHGFLMWTATLEPALEALRQACDVLQGWSRSDQLKSDSF
jgi:acetyl esterase